MEQKKYTYSRIISLAHKFMHAAFAGKNCAEAAAQLFVIADKMQKQNVAYVAAYIDTARFTVDNYTLITPKAVDPRYNHLPMKPVTAAPLTRSEKEDMGMGFYAAGQWTEFSK